MYPVRIIPAAAFLLLAVIASLLPSAPAPAADEPDYSGDLPRLAPLEPAKALESFKLAKGFRIDLVAAEPLVTDPIAMAFDEDGRLFVIEMRDYSEHPNDNLGQVRLLEDTDGDGIMDRSTIFAEKLSWPTAIICSQGGIFVGAAPHILYLKDTDGDGKADVNKIIYTGLGRSNVQGLVNTFLYGLDHRIHVAASSAGGTLTRPDDPNFKPILLRGRDFAFDPITFEAEAITGGAQHGATFDDFGRRFVCSNSDHIQMVMIEDRYTVNAAPGLAAPPARMSIAADGPQAEVFRISPVEPWRVLRTKLRVSGAVPGPVEGGGRTAGYFTSATGLTIYRGDAMPDQRGNAFVADVGSNIIHRKKLTPRGIGFIATRIDEKAEFVASTDTWFRPVQMANGPDGCLWVADMYREVIEHPASLPPVIKKHLDLNSGRDRGRIYRIAPEGFKPRPMPRLGKATTAELVALLEHDNAWHRETASRLIRERKVGDELALSTIRRLSDNSRSALGRLHALAMLESLGYLSKEDVRRGLADPEPGVREYALGLSIRWVAQDKQVIDLVATFVRSDHARLRYQAILAMRHGEVTDHAETIGQVLSRDGKDPYLKWAALNAAGGRLLSFIELLAAREEHAQLVEHLMGQLDKADVAAGMKLIDTTQAGTHEAVLRGLGWSILRTGGDPVEMIKSHSPRAASYVRQMIMESQSFLVDSKINLPRRLQAAAWLSLSPPSQCGPLFVRVLSANTPPELAEAAVAAMARHPSPEMTPFLIEGLNHAGPVVRMQLIDALLSRRDRMVALMDGVEKSSVPATYLSADQRMRLLDASDQKLRARATKLFAPAADRQAIIERYSRKIATIQADAAAGRKIFATQCAACHKLDSVGHELGPNLAAFAQRGNEAILINLLDPNREVNPQYLNYIVELKDGDIVTGLITSESATSITLASGNGVSRSIARRDIDSIRATGKSIMPEGIEATLSPNDAADLLSYLNSFKEARP